MADIGYYTLPVILSFDGVEKQAQSKLGNIFRTAGKSGSNDLAKGASTGLKTLERDVDSASKAYGRLRDKAADALGKVRVDEERLARARSGGKSDQIALAEERLAKSRRDSSRLTREAADAHNVLKTAQSGSATTATAAATGMSRLGTMAAGASTAITAGAVAIGASVAAVAALGAGVLVAGNRLYELGASFDDLSDNLQIKTGLSGAALDDLKGRVEKLGTTNVPSTFGEIGDVAAEVTRSLHLTGPEFDEVTSRLANLQRMGVDVDVRTLGKAFRGFGVDAKSQAPALNSLYEASTKSGLSIDDLTAAVVKGGPALRQLGIGFGQSAGLIASFEEAGLDGEKGMTALTKATTYFAKENIPAQQGLTDTITKIQQLGNTPEAADLANKVFGAKGGAAFFEAIKNGTLDLESLKDTLGSTGIDINKVSDDTADWSEKWQILKNNASVALEPLASGLFDAVNEQLGAGADALIAHKNDFIDFFESLGNIAITGAENFAHGIGGVLQALGDMVGGIGNVKGVLDGLMADFADLRGDEAGAAAFRASSEEAFGWGESLRAAGDKLSNLDLSGLRDGLHNAGEAAKDSGDKVSVLGTNVGALPPSKNIAITVDDTAAKQKLSEFGIQLSNLAAKAVFPIGPVAPGAPLVGGAGVRPPLPPGPPRSRGGVLPGWSPGRDNMMVPMAGGEGVLIPQAARALGGGPGINAINRIFGRGYASGGIVGEAEQYAASMNGLPYIYGQRDCSKAQSDVYAVLTGKPTGPRYFTTESDFESLGFLPGYVPGAYNIGVRRGGGGKLSHMAGTLPNGVNFEAGGADGTVKYGGNASGAEDFPLKFYLPVTGGDPSMSLGGSSSGLGTMGSTGGGGSTGTPGIGPNGEQGTYSVDPAKVRDADAQVAEADAKVREAEAKQRELKADAKESERIAAENDVAKAKDDARKARDDAAEAKRGDFTAAKDSTGGGGKGSGPQMSELGGIAKSFLTETFGLDGSWLPDIGNLAPLKMADALLSAFLPAGGGDDSGGAAGASTSSSAFGIPDIPAPPMPEGNQHLGPNAGGLPGPVQNNDLSVTFQGNVGIGPEEIKRQQERSQARGVARLTGIPLAAGQ